MSNQADIPEAQRTAPEKIWPDLGDMGDIDMPYDPTDDITWVDQDLGKSIPYVRADLVTQGSDHVANASNMVEDELTDEDLRKIAEAFIYSHQAEGQPFQALSDTIAFISLLNGESIRSQPFVALLRGLYEAGQQSVGQ